MVWDIILLCIIAISAPCMHFQAKIENPVLRCVPKSLAEDEPHTGGIDIALRAKKGNLMWILRVI